MSNRLKMRNPWLYFQSKGFLQKTQAGVTSNKKDFGTPTIAANGMALANVSDKSAALDSLPGLDIIVEAFSADNDGFHATKSQAESTKQRRLSDKEKFALADPRKKEDGTTTADSETISKGDRIKIREDIIKIDSGKVEVNDKTGDTNKGLTIGDDAVLTIIERKRAAAHGTNHVKGTDLLVPAYSFLGADAVEFRSGNGIDPDLEPNNTSSASTQRATGTDERGVVRDRRVDQTDLHFKAQSGNNATDVVHLFHSAGAYPDICKGMEIACNSHEYNKKIVMHTLDFDGKQTLLDYWETKGIKILGCAITLDAHAL
jgi:hypothetical protein